MMPRLLFCQPPRSYVELEGGKAVGADVSLLCLRQRLPLGSPQHRSNAGQKFSWAKRFGEVVISAELKTHDSIGFVVHAGQEDDGNSGLFAQPSGKHHAVLTRKAQIENYQIDRVKEEDTHHLLAGS